MARKQTALNKEVVLQTAIQIADQDGISGVTMRAVAKQLEVTPMSLYRYVANKDALLGEMVDFVVGEITLPKIGNPWKEEMRTRASSARSVLLKHAWAITLLDSPREVGMATLEHHDTVIGTLRHDGFSFALISQTMTMIDAYVYGFVIQELSLPFDQPEEEEISEMVTDVPEGAFSNLMEFVGSHVLVDGYSFSDQFEPGLDMILDGIENAAK